MPPHQKAFDQAKTWLRHKSGQVLLISGAPGSGKHALARDLAQSILCETPIEGQACGSCTACRYFMAQSHPDFVSLAAAEGEKTLKVAQIREQLMTDVIRQPQIGRSKVYLISADGLNEQGQNALLKTLEEPPPYAYLILTISSEEKLLPTVRSRVVPLRLMPLSASDLRAALAECGRHVDEKQAALLAALSNGAAGKALALLESSWFMELRADLWTHLQTWPRLPRYLLLTQEFDFLNAEKERYRECIQILQSFLRDLFALTKKASADQLLNQDLAQSLEDFHRQGHYGASALEHLLQRLDGMQEGLKVNENFEMAVCSLLLDFAEQKIDK